MSVTWRTVTLGDVITLKRGYDLPSYSRNTAGQHPIVSSSGVTGYHDEAKVEPPGVVTGRYGTTGQVFYVDEPFWPLNTTLYVLDFKGNFPLFVYFLLQTLDFEKYSAKTGVPGVNRNELHEIRVVLPPLPEQRKIAAILSTWDEAMTLTGQLIDALKRRKQALMQKLLTGEVRFPEFEGATWKSQKLSDVFERVTRKNNVGNTNVLTISAQHGLISQTEFFNKVVAGEDVTGYYRLKRGEFAYNRSYSAGYPYGALKRLDDYDEGILSTLYICFRLADELQDSDFWTYFFESGALNRGIYMVAQEGARNHGLLNINLTDFFDIAVNTPSPKAQQRLSEFFRVHDELLKIVRTQLERLQSQKRGLMQQLLTGALHVQVNE